VSAQGDHALRLARRSADRKDMQSAKALIEEHGRKSPMPIKFFYAVAAEALEDAIEAKRVRELNARAQRAVHKLYSEAEGEEARLWNYVLTLIDKARGV